MESHLAVLLPIAAVWLAAGLLADGLPRVDQAYALRRRAGWLLVLALTGLVLTAAVLAAGLLSPGGAAADRAAAALDVLALPALVVAACTVRRVRRLWAGAGAFASAPGTPAPHGLRAAAAHPLVGFPLQVAGLLAVPAVIGASGGDLLTAPGVTGPAITVGAVVVLAIGIRHALRHNRLAERARPEEPARLTWPEEPTPARPAWPEEPTPARPTWPEQPARAAWVEQPTRAAWPEQPATLRAVRPEQPAALRAVRPEEPASARAARPLHV